MEKDQLKLVGTNAIKGLFDGLDSDWLLETWQAVRDGFIEERELDEFRSTVEFKNSMFVLNTIVDGLRNSSFNPKEFDFLKDHNHFKISDSIVSETYLKDNSFEVGFEFISKHLDKLEKSNVRWFANEEDAEILKFKLRSMLSTIVFITNCREKYCTFEMTTKKMAAVGG